MNTLRPSNRPTVKVPPPEPLSNREQVARRLMRLAAAVKYSQYITADEVSYVSEWVDRMLLQVKEDR